ncbi:TetR/AcrR family transcriptional regulator [Cellulosilyticum sp. ST5]|uniref:Regulatory protein TetR n=1 Tax=Cellulosilyticum lentocellum (strain ATCC 49066 / DSM 5427 / NCIMB 11756 / RHM5) TaxID=642492 RepID=F2JPN6_CELLD|nr:TetR/AcrR family transcriptional regulator [Cellulosilyticum lentocellum]ADZ83696.1 regulatory protein TetR [Cellulosilyticum lentocellum DSM 5427]
MRELKSVEEKILDRALYLMGKSGTTNVPIRAIAKEAEVNVSAINYYFRSKNEMLQQVKEFYITNTTGVHSILDDEAYTEEERLILFANEIMEYTLRYPGLAVILKEAVSLKDQDELSKSIFEVTQIIHHKMERILARIINEEKECILYSRLIFMSSIIYPIENSELSSIDINILSTKEQRINYIKHIIKVLKNTSLKDC